MFAVTFYEQRGRTKQTGRMVSRGWEEYVSWPTGDGFLRAEFGDQAITTTWTSGFSPYQLGVAAFDFLRTDFGDQESIDALATKWGLHSFRLPDGVEVPASAVVESGATLDLQEEQSAIHDAILLCLFSGRHEQYKLLGRTISLELGVGSIYGMSSRTLERQVNAGQALAWGWRLMFEYRVPDFISLCWLEVYQAGQYGLIARECSLCGSLFIVAGRKSTKRCPACAANPGGAWNRKLRLTKPDEYRKRKKKYRLTARDRRRGHKSSHPRQE